jgi:hypothetical protein
MQKSANTDKTQRRGDDERLDRLSDKGRKFEPFHIAAIARDPRGSTRVRRLDQKR